MALQQTSFPFGDEQPPKPEGVPPALTPPGTPVEEAHADAAPEPPTFLIEPVAEPLPETPEPPAEVRAAPTPPTGELFIWDSAPEESADPITSKRGAGKTPAPKGPSEGRTEGRGRKSVKALAAAADLVDIPGDDVLFQKQYYAIGEVAAMFKVNTSLIRFWETEFSDIKPRKNKKGDRYFTPADIKTLELIHFLLRHKKLTIEGAKEYLKANRQDGAAKLELVRSLEKIKAFLLELRARL